MLLKHGNLTIRNAAEEDAAQLALWWNDGRIMAHAGFPNGTGQTAEIGIKLCDFSKQNKGIGKILLSMLIASLFQDLGYRRIILDTDLGNKRAQHVYEQLGFTKLRVRENAWRDQVGTLRSSVDYELYQKDFISYAV